MFCRINKWSIFIQSQFSFQCVIFPFILLVSCTDAQGYAPKYGYYPTQQGDWTLGSFNLVTQPTIVVWIKKDETVVDGFVVPREPKYYEKLSNRAKYVAKAICSFGNCRPVKRSQEVEVELITGYFKRLYNYH